MSNIFNENLIIAKAKKFSERSSIEVFDLLPFFSLLVSTGWNKNTDVFNPVELWRARHSPKDKPLNLRHNQQRIIGHILDCVPVNDQMEIIPDDTSEEEIPSKMHLVVACVLYKIWEEKSVQAEINKIIEDISHGRWYVSMECLFRNFDYLLMGANGEQKIIERNKKSNQLTKHLRQYKGSGRVMDYTIGRLLRQITFSGMGLVENPANPTSIISENLNLFSKAVCNLGYITNEHSGEFNMADTNEGKVLLVEDSAAYKKLLTDYENAQASIKDLQTKLDEINVAKASVSTLEKEVADLKKALSEKEMELDQEKVAQASTKVENDAMRKTIEEFKKASRNAGRAEKLMEVDKNLTKNQALQAVAKFGDLDDAVFASMVEIITGYASKVKSVTSEKVIASGEKEPEINYGSNDNQLKTVATSIKDWYSSGKDEK